MKKSKMIKIISALTAAVAFCMTCVYAYFSARGEQSESVGIDPSRGTVSVSDFGEFFSATQNGTYNDSSQASDVNEKHRKTVVLTDNITLEADLEITADINLDLGGHTLYLDGHTLTFRHSYHGSVVFSDGRVVLGAGGSGAVYADTPNAAVMLSDVTIGTLDDGIFTEKAEKFTVISADPDFVAYNFFKTVAAAVADGSQTLESRENYEKVKSKSGFTSSDFITLYKSDDCTSHGGVPCSYVFADIDLPMNYIGYPAAKVSYSTKNGIISDYGRKNGTGDDVITATITVGAMKYSCDFYVHVPDVSGEAGQKAAVLEMAKRYLSRYWVDETSDGIDTVSVKKYVINHSCYLPTKFGFCDVAISYTGYDVDGSETSASEEGSPFALFAPTLSTVRLTASALGATVDFEIVSSNVATVKNAVTVANDLLKKWYGTEITVTVDQNNVYTYSGPTGGALSDYLPLYGMNYYSGSEYEKAYPGIGSIEYSIVYGDTVDEYYEIGADEGDYRRFYVSSGKHPENDAGSVYLNVDMTITYAGRTSSVTIHIPVRCYVSGEEGLGRFLPYYSVFNKNISEQTGGYTLKSFDLPFNYRKGQPIVCYALSAKEGSAAGTLSGLADALTVYFVSSDGKKTALAGETVTAEITVGEETTGREIISFTSSLEELLPDAAALRAQAESGTAHYTVEIDVSKLEAENMTLSLTYQYKLSPEATSWTAYDLTTDITIPGVLRAGVHVTDAAFYAWIYNNFNPSGKAYADGDIILSDWLENNVTLDFANDTALSGVGDFTGLRYLVGTQKLLLSGASLTFSNIEEISYMRSLTTIDLSGCGISVTATETSPFLSWVSDSSRLENLVSVNLSGNTIYRFDWLETLGSKSKTLARITVSGNVPGTTDADNVFYGSDGLYNYGIYRELARQGIAIYSGGTASSPVPFADSRSSSLLYLSLCNVEYQNKIPKNASLDDVLAELSTSAGDYGISDEANNTYYSCTVQNQSITYSVTGENTFSLTYSAQAGGETYEITIRFSVTRG